MTIIHASTADQHLVATILPKIAQDNIDTVRLAVTFDSSWDNITAKTAVFTTSLSSKPYEVILSSDGNCLIPSEVLAEACKLYITVKGTNAAGAKKSTTRLTVKVLEGTPAVIVSDPSQSVYQQLLTAYAVMRARLNIAEKGATVDSEVAGIRAGYDGTEYETAGDAVRAQIEPIAKQVKAKNLIDFKRLTRGYFTESGAFSKEVTGYQEVTSDFIEINPSSTYYFAHRFSPISAAIKNNQWVKNWFGFCLYDAEKAFIKRIAYDALDSVIKGEVFEGATYVRVCYRTYMFNHPVFAESAVPCEAMDERCETDNLLDTYPLIFDGYVASTDGTVIGATIGENGYIPAEHNELTSDFIPCEDGKEMFIFATASHDNFIRIAFYGVNGEFLSSFAYGPTSTDHKGVSDYDNIFDIFTVPENAVALRVSCRGAYITESVLAYNDNRRKNIFTECKRKYLSKYETEKIAQLSATSWVKGIAHRGLSTDAPENTLSAYRLAKKKGFSYVECDVSFTSDGYAVLLHDSTIDRTSNGTGSIAGMTFTEVRELDFGSWKSADYAGEQIPTFEEFIRLCKRLGLHPYIEVKTGTEAQIKGLVDTVKRYGMKGKVTWISFNADYLYYIKSVDVTARLGFVVDSVSASSITTILQRLRTGKNEVFIDCSNSNATDDAVTLCMDADIPLEVWTVNNANAILTMNSYISGVTSDNLIAGKVLFDNETND